MIVAIMQPYFFPYIGYFQLMKVVDTFVIFDNVQYMKGGWINRNRIRSANSPVWFTMPVQRDTRKLPINQRHYKNDKTVINSLKRRLDGCYSVAPAYEEVMPLIFELLDYPESNIAHFNANLLKRLAGKLSIECRWLFSSDLTNAIELVGQDRVLDICRCLGATGYVNAIGGVKLYDPVCFEEYRTELYFLQTDIPPVDFSEGPSHLSIIDLLCRNGFSRCQKMLSEYKLIQSVPNYNLNREGL